MSRIFFRCLVTREPTRIAFVSSAAAGEEMRPPYTPERMRLWDGISIYDSRERARWRGARMTPPRRWIAVLLIPDDSLIMVEKTLRDPAHFTAWATPEQFIDCVLFIVSAD